MIVCQCNVLTDKMINKAVRQLLVNDPYRLITPGLIYKTLGKAGKCCGCFPQATEVIIAEIDRVWGEIDIAGQSTNVVQFSDEKYRKVI